MLPVLEFFPNRAELAPRVYDYLERARPLRNTGALTAVIPRRQFARVKPLIAVRSAAEFRTQLVRSALLYFAGFYIVALVWRLTKFRGDAAFLPALQLLTGFGFLLMVSMRDPLRDTLEFHKFAIGVFLGSLLLALPAFQIFDYRRLSRWCYTPLFAALGLFGLLMAFGRGPAGNDAKVNLGIFQPVELIKILLVMFLAGYFTRNWERLRDLREERVPGGRVARAEHVLPVMVATGISIVLFFVLKDLGPALVTLFVFLAMFTVARGRPVLAIAAVVLMVAAVAVGYRAGTPHTVVQRIDMWLSPWDNDVHGGDQLAHALWAFATGGPTGSGPGWGDPGDDSGGEHGPGAAGDRRRVGLCRRGRGLCSVRRFDLARHSRGAARRHHVRTLSGNRTLHAHRLRDAADHVRRARARCRFRAWCRRFSVREIPRWWRISWSSRCWPVSAIPTRCHAARRTACAGRTL